MTLCQFSNLEGNIITKLRIFLVAILIVGASPAFTAHAQIETNLHSFAGADGAIPLAASLVQGNDGNFYGTAGGGTNVCFCGTIFRISPSGSFTNLYFSGSVTNDGGYPAGLVRGSDGYFYSTTYLGGVNDSGTVFRFSPTGGNSNLYSFGSVTNDGNTTLERLVEGTDGNFYGITGYGGTSDRGTIYRISPTGSYTNLYSFPNGAAGAYPQAGLVQGSDGNFYGAADNGGTNSCLCGTVFRFSPTGSFTNLYSFGSVTNDGVGPDSGLVQGSDGSFYGTTQGGGANNAGTVFKLTVPLNPPPNQISRIQLSATNVVVTIPSIAGETYQLQTRNSLTPGSWSNVPGAAVTNSIGASLTLTNLGSALQTQAFYQVQIRIGGIP